MLNIIRKTHMNNFLEVSNEFNDVSKKRTCAL